MLPDNPEMVIAYDIEEMKPGCAIIQSDLGATSGIAGHFDSRHWLTAPTPGMRLYPVTPDQLAQLVEMTEKAHPIGVNKSS